MGLLDIVSKTILNEGPQDLIRLACPNLRIDSVTSLEKEVFSVQRSADKLFQIHLGNEESPLHLHIEVNAQWESDLAQRMHEYWTLFSTKHPKLDSILIVLQDNPSKGRPKSSYKAKTPLGRRLNFEFNLLCLWKFEAKDLSSLNSPVLLPLLPFTKGASVAQVYEAFEQLEALEEDRTKREIRASLVGTAKLKFEEVNWLKHIGGKAALMGTDIFEEIIQEGVEKGFEQGVENERISILKDQLRARFGKKVEASVKKLGKLDGKTLRELATKIVAIRDDEAFLAELRKTLAKR